MGLSFGENSEPSPDVSGSISCDGRSGRICSGRCKITSRQTANMPARRCFIVLPKFRQHGHRRARDSLATSFREIPGLEFFFREHPCEETRRKIPRQRLYSHDLVGESPPQLLTHGGHLLR